jgi:hypothetical protein
MESIRTEALLKFIDEAEKAGRMKHNSARGKRAVVRLIMRSGCSEVSFLYSDMVLETIQKKLQFSYQSLKTYQSRINSLVRAYKDYLNNGFNFPVVQAPTACVAPATGVKKITTQMVVRGDIVTFSGFPTDLSQEEYERIVTYLKFYVV